MNIKTGKGFGKLVDQAMSFIDRDPAMSRALSDTELSIGFDSEAGFGVPASAINDPLFMGDEAFVGQKNISAAAEAMLKKNPNDVQIKPNYNEATGKFDIKFAMAGDAEFDPLAGQLFSPWNITYLSKVWKEPLAYSNAQKLIRKMSAGNNPFAEIFTLFMEQYAGWGVIGQTGNLQNSTTNDVNVKTGMASFPIINIMGTYSVTLREKKQQGWGPFGQSPVARKQSYLNYVMDMIECILILYGNEDTNTPGLLNVNPIKTWTTGESVKDIYNSSTNQTRGSTVYRMLAERINQFMTRSDNKFKKIQIGVSPEAYNMLQSMAYSDVYSPEAAMKTFMENYNGGKGPGHDVPSIEFVIEPLFKASEPGNVNPLNPNSFDYMSITTPEIGGGPKNESQPTNFYASVLDKFVFPVIPGMYNDQYKTLRRTAGVIAPIPQAVEIYAGFGVQN